MGTVYEQMKPALMNLLADVSYYYKWLIFNLFSTLLYTILLSYNKVLLYHNI
jgi:hypothetical protein